MNHQRSKAMLSKVFFKLLDRYAPMRLRLSFSVGAAFKNLSQLLNTIEPRRTETPKTGKCNPIPDRKTLILR